MLLRLPRRAYVLFFAVVFLLPVCAKALNTLARTGVSLASSPVGRWKTFSSRTGEAKSIIAIWQKDGTLYGTIEHVFDPPVPHPRCIRCTGSMKDRPVLGLRILWGMRKDGDQWSGGQILDPQTGKIYTCTLRLEDGGRVLRVHGYIGISLFGRTVHWRRVDSGH